ncbi:Twin-arginine translocation protein TatA [Minicystis rosea]|nr:Twin-arginine translocation protein TatA [Minicystis rosea]
MHHRTSFAALIMVPALAGCGASGYRPHTSPRLQMVSDGSGLALARDGHTYSIGMFGSGLEDAVRGNARAEKEVSTYQAKTVGGFVVGLLGSLASAGGVGLLVGNELSNNPSNGARAGAISLAVGGLVASIVASVLASSAQPHMWNAINMYNDDLPAPWGFGPQQPPYGQPYGAPGGYNVPSSGYMLPGYAAPRPWPAPGAVPNAGAPSVPVAPAPQGPTPQAPMPQGPTPQAPAPSAPAPAPSVPPSPGAPR